MRATTRTQVMGGVLAIAVVLVLGAAVVVAGNELDDLNLGGETQEQLARETTISQPQAEAAALAALAGSIKDTALEREDGRVVYEIEVQPAAGGDEMDVLVDAMTGQVLEIEED